MKLTVKIRKTDSEELVEERDANHFNADTHNRFMESLKASIPSDCFVDDTDWWDHYFKRGTDG